MFAENIKRAGTVLSPFIGQLKKIREQNTFPNYLLIQTKMDVPTLQIEQEGRKLFLHSKYNPIQEAKKIAQDFKSAITEKNHIIFFGVGLGYHIQEIMTLYPEKKFTMIEPDSAIFLRFLESRLLKKFPFSQMSTLYIPIDEVPINQFLASLSIQLKGDASIVVFPAYERLFNEQVNEFYTAYREVLKMTKSNIIATQVFGKRWILNSLMNTPTTLSTQNIKEKVSDFKGKPIIIASAGPSLYEDLEHLKFIKEKGLAYIFAVGSANKAFLSHGIVPDAVLTYDPQPHNINVFKELIASGRTDIPMIYGTSVGFETIEAYQGPKFHLVNSADSVTNYYLNKQSNEFDVSDSTTIALIAIQVAELLAVETIFLAGQNLAFRENRYYAKGIEHGQWKGQVREDKEGQKIKTTKDVYGNLIDTNESLINMRKDIELYLEMNAHIQVINTTKGGAAIKGAPFEPIEQVIKERLQSTTVNENWFMSELKEPTDNMMKQVRKMETSVNKMYESLDACRTILQRLDVLKRTNKIQQINKLFVDFDKQFDLLIKNDFYICFIASVLQQELDQLYKTIRKSYVVDQVEKIDIITSSNMLYLGMVQEIFGEMVVHVKEIIHPKILEQSTDWKLYKHNDSVFHYEGNWERETLTFNDLSRTENIRKISRTISTMSVSKGARITFKFEGTALELHAQTHADFSNDIKVIIDGEEKMVRTKDRKLKDGLSPKLQQIVFEVHALPNGIHNVCIELTTDEKFAFQGVKIDAEGRAFHIDEVTTMEELEVGKRIRCHLSAGAVNGVVSISSIGEEIVRHMTIDSTKTNDDFYLIKLHESKNGESKFGYNRNLGLSKIEYKANNVNCEITLNSIPLMESEESVEGKASCSTFYSTNTNQWAAYKAFNRKIRGLQNAWATEKGVTEGWIAFEFSNPVKINCYSMINQERHYDYDTTQRMPRSWTVQGWNGVKWIKLDEKVDVIDWKENEKKYFTFENEISYQKYKILVTRNNGDSNFLAIGEVEFN